MGIGLEKIIKDWFLSKGASSESYDRYVSYDKNYLINLDCYLSLQKGWLKNGQLPEFINFGTINANFYANNCGLKTMRGFPKIIKGSFTCNENYIKSLEYCPKYVKLDFEMIDNSVSFSTRQIKKVCDVGGKIIL